VDCNNGFTPISGATNQSFTAVVDGDYAVIISGNSCADTSSCHTIFGLGVEDLATKMHIEVFPNPTTGKVIIQNQDRKELSLEVLDLTGRQVYSTKITNKNTEINLGNYADGIYLFKFYNEKEVFYLKLIKE
jgi:hypothetical protein